MTSMPGRVAREHDAAGQGPMRLLLVGYWFPPTNAIGAVRAGKFAGHMRRAGHDVRVLAGPAHEPLGLPLDIEAVSVIRPEINPPSAPRPRTRLRERSDAIGLTDNRAVALLRRHLDAARTIPDKQRPWIAPAVGMGRALIRDWRPDLIVASAPPYSCLRVAAALSAETGVPWIAELRDPWSGNVYNERPGWRDWLDRRLEERTLRTAAALVAVSPVVERDLQARYTQPVTTVPNGFSPEDMPPAMPGQPHDCLAIVYTGTIYTGHRDPSALFAAIALLPEPTRDKVRVVFYGPEENQVHHLAARYSVRDNIEVRPSVSYDESLRLQAEADILLLLQRSDRSDEGNVPAKFFEYLGALRPILLLGYKDGVLAATMRERGAGMISNDPAQIAARLGAWVEEARRTGIASLPESARAGLTRDERFRAYEEFLRGIIAPKRS